MRKKQNYRIAVKIIKVKHKDENQSIYSIKLCAAILRDLRMTGILMKKETVLNATSTNRQPNQ